MLHSAALFALLKCSESIDIPNRLVYCHDGIYRRVKDVIDSIYMKSCAEYGHKLTNSVSNSPPSFETLDISDSRSPVIIYLTQLFNDRCQ